MLSSLQPCDFCGQSEAARVGDQFICADCYIASGSCCAGEVDQEKECRQKDGM